MRAGQGRGLAGAPAPWAGAGVGGRAALPEGVAPKTLTTGTLLTGASLKRDWQGSRPGTGLLR